MPRAVDAAPTPPAVRLVSPSSAAPAVVATGGPVTVRFTVDRAVQFRVGYRPTGSSAPFALFPDAVGRGLGAVDL